MAGRRLKHIQSPGSLQSSKTQVTEEKRKREKWLCILGMVKGGLHDQWTASGQTATTGAVSLVAGSDDYSRLKPSPPSVMAVTSARWRSSRQS